MDAETIATLSAITGLPTDEASGFLEMGAPTYTCRLLASLLVRSVKARLYLVLYVARYMRVYCLTTVSVDCAQRAEI